MATYRQFIKTVLTLWMILISAVAFSKTLYFPLTISTSTWETEICVVNNSGHTVSGTFHFFDNGKTAMNRSHDVTLPPFGRTQESIRTLFPSEETIGYITLETTRSDVSGYLKLTMDGFGRMAVPALSNADADTLFLSHGASGEHWWTGICLTNITDTARQVQFAFNDGTFAEIIIAGNSDGTITDRATGLMWSRDDSKTGMNWKEALAWVQEKNQENYLGHDDWRLPNAKEMQSIIDYSRAPDVTGTAAIDPVFNITRITNENRQDDYPWFWTGTTHVKSGGIGSNAAYLCFGRALGYMNGSWMDVHGAGAPRSDQKGGDFSKFTYTPDGCYFDISPQGDAVRIYSYVRLARDNYTSSDNSVSLFVTAHPENSLMAVARLDVGSTASVSIDHTTGDIVWILGDDYGIAQHAAMMTADGQILLYDNRNESDGAFLNSRAVKYRLDESTTSASQTWEAVAPKYTKQNYLQG